MGQISASVGHNLHRLSDFSGRDARATFWPWAIMLFLVDQIVSMALMAVPMSRMFTRAMQAVATVADKPVDPAEVETVVLDRMMTDLGADMQTIWLPSAVLSLAVVALLAAAVVRRLHDRGKAGWWGLLPLPFLVASHAAAPAAVGMFMGRREPSGLEGLLLLPGWLFWIALAVLVVQLAGEGDSGPNRFGPEPGAAR